MNRRLHRLSPLAILILAAALYPSCNGEDSSSLLDIPVVIDAASPAWSADPPFALSAVVTKAGSGDAVGEAVSVSVEVLKVGPLENNQSFTIPASRSTADPKLFEADAVAAGPFHPNQQVRFRWSATAPIGGETTELGATDTAEFQIDADTCDSDAESYLREMHAAVVDSFDGMTTLGEIFAQGYVLNNHGYASLDGLGVTFVHPNPVFAVEMPEVLAFKPADGSNVTDNTSCAGTCVLGVLGPCLCSACDSCKDEPYELIGWFYGVFAFDPEVPRPVEGCIPHHYWFLHEAGWHTASGGMMLDPTPEAALDPAPVDCPTAASLCASTDRYHPRVWDLHFWVNREAMEEEGTSAVLPRVAIYNTDGEGNLIPGGGLNAPTTAPSDAFPEGQCMFFYSELGCDGAPG